MTEVTLKPCPLCNGHAVMWEDGDPKYPWCVTFEHADECPLYAVPTDFFRSYPTEAEAAAAWNQRHTRPASTEPVDALAEAREALEAPWSWACPETGTGHDNRGQEDCPDCGFPVCIEPDWQNAGTCIENVMLAYANESVCDEDGPVDTVVSSGDLYVLLSLAGAAYHARAALSRLNAQGEGK